MKKFTKKQRAVYYKDLRARWEESKKLAETNEIKAIIKECLEMGVRISPYSIAFTAMEMKAKNLDGLPMIDAKTYNKWAESGFKVKKGEKSVIHGITWVQVGKKDKDAKKDDDTKSFLMPKTYSLFHRSQVEPVEQEAKVKEDIFANL